MYVLKKCKILRKRTVKNRTKLITRSFPQIYKAHNIITNMSEIIISIQKRVLKVAVCDSIVTVWKNHISTFVLLIVMIICFKKKSYWWWHSISVIWGRIVEFYLHSLKQSRSVFKENIVELLVSSNSLYNFFWECVGYGRNDLSLCKKSHNQNFTRCAPYINTKIILLYKFEW